jgi:hypothetical protein
MLEFCERDDDDCDGGGGLKVMNKGDFGGEPAVTEVGNVARKPSRGFFRH